MPDFVSASGGHMRGPLYLFEDPTESDQAATKNYVDTHGGGSGTVTSVSVTTANGVSGSVANATTTPAISLTLGAITPTSVSASGNVTGSNLSGTNTGNETTTTIGSLINGATSKSTPVDADQLGLMDSAASNILKKLSWSNVKATLKTYFDTIYSTGIAVDLEVPSGSIDGSNVTFTLAHNPITGSLHLYLNGVLQDPTDDFSLSTNTITFTIAPSVGTDATARLRASYRY